MCDTVVKKRIDWIDVAKGIGVICVILGHISKYQDHWKFVQFLYGFHVGAFFILSGITFKKKINCKFKDLMESIIKHYVIPYIISVSFILICKELFTADFHFFENLKGYALQIRAGSIWFITVLALSKVIIWFLNNRIKNSKLLTAIIVIIFCLGCISLKYYNRLFWNLDLVPMGMFFVYFGVLISDRMMSLNISKVKCFIFGELLLLVSFISTVINRLSQDVIVRISISDINIVPLYVLSIISGFFGISLLSMILSKSKFLSYIGKNSFSFIALNSVASDFVKACEPLKPFYMTATNVVQNVTVYFFSELVILFIMSVIYNVIVNSLLSLLDNKLLKKTQNSNIVK